MTTAHAFVGCEIFDGWECRSGMAIVIENNVVAGCLPERQLADSVTRTQLNGGILVPGFVDLQVNGGGGVLFNEQPDVDGIRTICSAHSRFGTTGLLPTLITDTPQITEAAINAGIEAYRQQVPGFLGLHLEGPHLSPAKHGAHEPSLIRSMDEGDLQLILAANNALPNLIITVAPESVSNEQIARLSQAGVAVSLGHSAANCEATRAAFSAGARSVTHLYNAMSPLSHRDPGMVGAAMDSETVYCGIIADGYHVDPAAIRIALNNKNKTGKVYLVTDAMSTIGTDQSSFKLNGRTILRSNGRLTLEDGTLAGADLDMLSAVHYMYEKVGVPRWEALRMASLYPGACLNPATPVGRFVKGAAANMLWLDDNFHIRKTWIEGRAVD